MFDLLPSLPFLPSLPINPFQPFQQIFNPIKEIGDLLNFGKGVAGDAYEKGKEVVGDVQDIVGHGIETSTSSFRKGIFGDFFGNLTLPALVLVVIVLGLGAMIIF